MARFVFATFCLLVLAAIAHLGAILLIPWQADRHAVERLRATLSAQTAQPVHGLDEGGWLARHDPYIAMAACAFDLADGPFHFTTKPSPHFHSIAIHSRGTGAFFALTDRSVEGEVIDIIVMTREQRLIEEALLAQAIEEDETRRDDGIVRVIAPEEAGFVAVRVLAPLASLRQKASEIAQAATCAIRPLDLD
jgi:uncharacterized membrane protein